MLTFPGLVETRVIADLHIHSRHSRATSTRMDVDEITRFAPIKGLNLVGSGDFTHPRWFQELREELREVAGTALYERVREPSKALRFMITGEVSTIFTSEGESKKIHHVILTPSLETADQINDRLAQYGDLKADGRPILDASAPLLVEEVMEASTENMVIPAHVWTPWFSLFGDFSGFDRIEDCYQDMTRHICALETGLSSDPPMNWRLSALDRFTLVSNSDSHSSWPWRIGREANVFELSEFTYSEILDAIRSKDTNRFTFTVETYPDYGKYHWTGHRNCHVSLSAEQAVRSGGVCPVCRKKLTKGVEQRVEELADRPAGFKPEHVPEYKRLLPLSEIIAAFLGATYPGAQNIWKTYNKLVSRFGDEYSVLIDAGLEDMSAIVDPRIAEAVVRVREGNVKVIPGYDGVYGKIEIFPSEDESEEAEEAREVNEEGKQKSGRKKTGQSSLTDFDLR